MERKHKPAKPLCRWPKPKELLRFLTFIKTGDTPEGFKTPCWLWIGHKDEKGYGQFQFARRAHWAHRFSYQAFNRKKLPEGREACHLCHNSSCVNPLHLKADTKSNNVKESNHRRKRRKIKPKLEAAPF